MSNSNSPGSISPAKKDAIEAARQRGFYVGAKVKVIDTLPPDTHSFPFWVSGMGSLLNKTTNIKDVIWNGELNQVIYTTEVSDCRFAERWLVRILPTTKEERIHDAESRGFGIGAKVRITTSVPSTEWPGWTDDMTGYCGKETTIKDYYDAPAYRLCFCLAAVPERIFIDKWLTLLPEQPSTPARTAACLIQVDTINRLKELIATCNNTITASRVLINTATKILELKVPVSCTGTGCYTEHKGE